MRKTRWNMASYWTLAALATAMWALCWMPVLGAALDAARNTPERAGRGYAYTQGLCTIYAGSIVAVSNGTAYPAADVSGYKVVGKAMATQDNTGAAYDATRTIEVANGIFRWENGGSFTTASPGELAYVSDDQTVRTSAATYDIVAGVIVWVDDDGVWVDTGNIPRQGAQSVASLAVSGAATVGTTLGVTGAATLSSTLAVTGNSTLGGTLAVTGAATLPVVKTVVQTATSRVCTSADYGKLIVVSTNAAVAITLPANGAAAGSWIDFVVAGTDDCAPTVAAASADTLRGPNDVDLDSVTYGTGHRIGAYLRCISDGAFWTALNLGTTTMTGND
jgi:hypothetical protein